MIRLFMINNQIRVEDLFHEYTPENLEKVRKLFEQFKPQLDELFALRVLTKNRIRDYLSYLKDSKESVISYVLLTHRKGRWNSEKTNDPEIFEKAKDVLIQLAEYPYYHVEPVLNYYLREM